MQSNILVDCSREWIEQRSHCIDKAASDAMRRAAAVHGITRLVHLTRVENVAGIFHHGLLSRRQLKRRGVDALINDFERHDGHLDHVCLSVTWPNWRLLRAWQLRYPGASWAMLIIRPNLLWEADCLFCPTNSASARMRCRDPGSLRGCKAFEGMFDQPGSRPADVQAEVLVPGSVATNRIECVYFDRPSVMKAASTGLPPTWLRASPRWFGRPA